MLRIQLLGFIGAFLISFAPPSYGQTSKQIHPDTVLALKKLRSDILSWAPRCNDGTLTFHECPFGDALEYMGMLCLSGEEKYCDYVKQSQDTGGRWWRSPGLVGHEEGVGGNGWATFSRDMARGAWAYIVAKKDKTAALQWMNYIQSNEYKLCAKSKEGWDACSTRMGFWNFAREVYDWLGLPRTRKMQAYKSLILRLYSPLEALTQPRGFQMILTAEAIYTLYEMEKRGAKLKDRDILERVARIIHTREPKNPFYEYLVNGATEKGAQTLLKYCPRTQTSPPVDSWGPIYAVEFGEKMSKKNYLIGGGHYCNFLINIYTQSVP